VGWTSWSYLEFWQVLAGSLCYTAKLISVAKYFSLFQNHSLSLAKLQNVTALCCTDCSGQNADMTAMQQLKASEEGCPKPLL
jgi:hypothetical protein